MYDISDFEVGDEIETSPNELSQIISAISAIGGRVRIDGASLFITYLPGWTPPEEGPIFEYPSFEELESIEPEIEEVVEEVKVEVSKAEEPKVEVSKAAELKEEVKATVVKPKGRPRKTVPPVQK